MGVDFFSGTPSSLRRPRMVTMSLAGSSMARTAAASAGKSAACGIAGEGDGFCGWRCRRCVERVPELFGEEGHEGREQAQGGLEDADERALRVSGGDVVACAGVVEVEAEFDELEVPVAELAPEELVDGVGGFVEAVVGEGAVDLGGDGAEAGEDPAGFERAWSRARFDATMRSRALLRR